MDKKVLVIYASKHGSTAEIAEKIGEALRQEGIQVNVVSAQKVKYPADYDAIVIGSSVYIGQWRSEVSEFIKVNEKTLANKPVWLFSSGPTGKGDAGELLQGWRYPFRLKALVERIKPRDIAVFHGALDMQKMGFLDRWMVKRVKSPVGDFRDWNVINKWAKDIAEVVKKQG
jgi:menaquinone-dependent protoporphyrinogen oxidase